MEMKETILPSGAIIKEVVGDPIEYIPPPDDKPLDEKISELEQKNVLLEAQSKANADRTDFHEDLIVELASMVYQ